MRIEIESHKALKNIETILLIIMCCAVIQTAWFLFEKVLNPAAAVAARMITDVNIMQIDGKRIDSPYTPAIKVKK